MKPPCIKSSTDTCFNCSVVKIITPDNDKKTLLMINYVGRVMCSDVKKKAVRAKMFLTGGSRFPTQRRDCVVALGGYQDPENKAQTET